MCVVEIKNRNGKNKQHKVNCRHLETELGEQVANVIWKWGGIPYEAKILKVIGI